MYKRKREYYFFSFVFLVLAVMLLLKCKENANTTFLPKLYKTIKFDGRESCLNCHKNTKGYSEYHNPKKIGCVSCHLGNPNSNSKKEAHKNMVLVPGNLNDAEQTCGKCHTSELHKIKNSLMTTNSGLVAVNKFVFGEANTPNYHYHIKNIKQTAADGHLRDLCANCHLGAEKKDFGAITILNRGGGCNACHLNYTNKAKKDLQQYLLSDKKELPKEHPSTDIFVKNEHCFGCHSRSSRISTNYEGWQETLLNEKDIASQNGYKTIEDKRVYKYIEEDVHHSKGLLCIDCHTSHEVMGDGKKYTHAEQAVKIQCGDCHFKEKPNTIAYDSLDVESLKVFLHRDYKHKDKKMIVVKKSKHPLVNTFVNSLNEAYLIGKKDGKLHKLSPQSEVCSKDKVHSNLSCATCHSSWTNRCIGCHNQYDKTEIKAYDLLSKVYKKGQWKEYVSEFSHGLPSLGIREDEKKIEPAIPGMIMTIDKGSYVGRPNTDVVFHRLYAPNSPHTTVKKSRSCISCHANSEALGYGKGKLIYKIVGFKGKWFFESVYENNTNDNLPEDAWIPFLKPWNKKKPNSTRTDFRPFTIKEQQQILMVGSCLQCHEGNSVIMQNAIEKGLKSQLKKTTKKCVLPIW